MGTSDTEWRDCGSGVTDRQDCTESKEPGDNDRE